MLWDLKRYKTYVLLFIVSISSFSFAYLIPEYSNGLFATYPGGPESWVFSSAVMFNSIATGFIAVITGGIMTTDTLAYELEKGTMMRLFSMPVSSNSIFFGKLIEKVILSFAFSVIIILSSVAGSTAVFGSQKYLDWIPVIIPSLMLLFMSYASFGMLAGTLVRQPGFIVGIVIGLWVLCLMVSVLLLFKTRFNLFYEAIPFVNASEVPSSLYGFIQNPHGMFTLTASVANSSTRQISIPDVKYALMVIVSTLAETGFILSLAATIFRKSGEKVK